MKLYTYPAAPSPRRVHLFLAEKDVVIEQVVVDIRAGEHFQDWFLEKSPCRTVPALELDDGVCISDAVAICRYFEEARPDPPLMGTDARERAIVTMWDRHMEAEGFSAVAEAFRNSSPRLAGRALPGIHPVEQIPALAERGRQRYRHFLADLDGRLKQSEHIAGEHFSVADITALVIVEFARWALEIAPEDDQINIARWLEAVSGRPAVAANPLS